MEGGGDRNEGLIRLGLRIRGSRRKKKDNLIGLFLNLYHDSMHYNSFQTIEAADAFHEFSRH